MNYPFFMQRDYKSILEPRQVARKRLRRGHLLLIGGVAVAVGLALGVTPDKAEATRTATQSDSPLILASAPEREETQDTVQRTVLPLALPLAHPLAATDASDTIPTAQPAARQPEPAPAAIATKTPRKLAALHNSRQTRARVADPVEAPTAVTRQANTPTVELEQELPWRTVKIRSGDSLAAIFSHEGISADQLHAIIAPGGAAKQLTRIHPGDELRLQVDADKQLQRLDYKLSVTQTIKVIRKADGSFETSSITRVPEQRTTHASGQINSSLFLAGQRAGLSDNLTMEVASIFGWDVDFALDIREGDSFTVLYDELYLDGEKIGDGNIIAAEFVNQGRSYKAVRFTDDDGISNYYTPDGKSMRKAFLRTPVAFSRISSRFDLSRKHPVLNRIRAHKGVDYAAARGTPIKSTGDGKIIFRGTKGGYGKTVIVQHGNTYQTLYAHLNNYRKGQSTGSRVKQGDVIGYVGSTGLATGPHLHYEFRVNGAVRNPLTVALPTAEPLPRKYRDRFSKQADTLVARLERVKQTTLALQQY